MPRFLQLAALALLAACNDTAGSGGAPARSAVVGSPTREELAAELAARRVGCVGCHGAPVSAPAPGRLAPIPGPALADAARWHARDGGAVFLRRHHGGEQADALAAWVASLATDTTLRPAATSAGAMARGEQLFGELACGACHSSEALAELASRTDHAHVADFLLDPTEHRPGVVHDFLLSRGEADALAAWLLRAQIREHGPEAVVPGFAYECFELRIEDGGQPELDGLEPVSSGVVPVVDVEQRSRENHFAMRFRATITVPAAGEWRFTLGSDDGSWLWIDGQLQIDNGGIKPHRRANGSVQLGAGPHELEVVFTQGSGGKSLELLWQGPGVEEEPIPARVANARTLVLVPPVAAVPSPDPDAVHTGRGLASALQCGACHAFDDPEFTNAIVSPAPGKPWSRDFGGECPRSPAAAGIAVPATASLHKPLDARSKLQLMLMRDACLSCHVRDGAGGLQPAVQRHLVEIEDLGEEGRLPPDLTRVGYRLRQSWIEKVLAEGHRARPYLRVRMPRVPAERAAEYAALFAAVDCGEGHVDEEPPFGTAAVEAGRQSAGVKGRNCISCHSFSGAPSLGPQGMDLAIQHQRLRPGWFREWLLRAPMLRAGTRMPLFWPLGNEEDRREVDAIRTWVSLGAAAPVPEGLVPERGSLVLLASDRPVLHGAFLDRLSARCIAVGTRERTHYAFDVAHGRLAWLWRGDFLDATGTWHGRAGQLLKPLGADWVVLEDFTIAGGADRTVRGHRITPDGYPVFRVRSGDAEYDDDVRPRLAAAGSELVRTLRCASGRLTLAWPSQDGVTIAVNGQSAPATSSLAAGEELEVVYRW